MVLGCGITWMVPPCRCHLSYKICLTIKFLHVDLTNLAYLWPCFSKSLIFICMLKIITIPCHCIELFLLSRNPLQILLQYLLRHFNIVCSVRSVLQLVLIAPTTPYELGYQSVHQHHHHHHNHQHHHHLKNHQYQCRQLLLKHLQILQEVSYWFKWDRFFYFFYFNMMLELTRERKKIALWETLPNGY